MSQFQKNNKSIEKSAKNKDLALELALNELGVTQDEVEVEVIDEGSKGFLGLGARDARIKVTLKQGVVPKTTNKTKTTTKADSTKSVQKKSAPKTQEKSVKRTSVTSDGDQAPADEAKNFLSGIFNAMNLEVNIDAKMEDQAIAIDLSGENMGIVIGKRGDTLDSLQYLTSLVVNQNSEDYIKITIDTENYREKRADALLALSSRLADKVTKTGKKFTLEPMNPYERRIIHANLQGSESVTTYSIGSEPYRKVVIAPKNSKPYKKDDYRKSGYKKDSYKKDGYKRRDSRPESSSKPTAEKTGTSYTTTYKADFKPQQHKAEYKNFEDYLAGHSSSSEDDE